LQASHFLRPNHH